VAEWAKELSEVIADLETRIAALDATTS